MSQLPSFSPTHYEHVIQRIEDGLKKLPSVVHAALRAYEEEFGFFLSLAGELLALDNHIMSDLNEFIYKVEVYLKDCVSIPFDMYNYAKTWLQIENSTGNMSGAVMHQAEVYSSEWSGIAGGAYYLAVTQTQPGALNELSEWAGTVCDVCGAIAQGGLTFYLALLTAVSSVASGCVDEDIPSPWGIAASIANGITQVEAAVAAFLGALGPKSSPVNQLDGLLGSGGEYFYNNTWPPATSS
jgi:hypothetical protein